MDKKPNRLKQFLKRIRGISTPFFGVEWEGEDGAQLKKPDDSPSLIRLPTPEETRQITQERKQADQERESPIRRRVLCSFTSRHVFLWLATYVAMLGLVLIVGLGFLVWLGFHTSLLLGLLVFVMLLLIVALVLFR